MMIKKITAIVLSFILICSTTSFSYAKDTNLQVDAELASSQVKEGEVQKIYFDLEEEINLEQEDINYEESFITLISEDGERKVNNLIKEEEAIYIQFLIDDRFTQNDTWNVDYLHIVFKDGNKEEFKTSLSFVIISEIDPEKSLNEEEIPSVDESTILTDDTKDEEIVPYVDESKLFNIEVLNENGSYRITADIKGDIASVSFPTWTSKNGQDDITWENGTIDGSKISYVVDMKDHGYETGSYNTHIYAYDKAGEMFFYEIPTQQVKYDLPEINDISITKNATSYTVTATVSGYNLSSVSFPTWTKENGQDDLLWGQGEIKENKISYTIDIKDHNFEVQDYITHIYLYDGMGNMAFSEAPIQNLAYDGPIISDVKVVDNYGNYKITAQIDDEFGIDYVVFPTWTSDGGQDDITWQFGELNGSQVSYTVDMKDHNFETKDYSTHIYAYSKSGKMTFYELPARDITFTKPSFENLSIIKSSDSYTISADITGYQIDKVLFPTWTEMNGQDDITWGEGRIVGNKVFYTVYTKDHYNEAGIYQTHMYIYDTLGNVTAVVLDPQDFSEPAPVISNISINQTAGKYTITCNVDSDHISSVEFPTWTNYNGQDDITWGKGVIKGNKVTYTVDMKDHNYEDGVYNTHIYAYDANGKLTTSVLNPIKVENNDPIISNITVTDITSDGYLVKCEVSDDYGLDRVLFPTWSDLNGQDDLTMESGEMNGSTVSYRVNVKDHKNNYGNYNTHIYAYDKAGKLTVSVLPSITIYSSNLPGWAEINGDKQLYDADRMLVGSGLLVIDISSHNGYIDWDTVKNAGVDGVILRSSYGYEDDLSQMDPYFKRNVSELNRLNIPYGIYHFSYATNVAEGKDEAEYVLRCMEEAGADPILPVYYDLEYSDYVGNKNSAFYTELSKNFMHVIQSAGYQVGVYANYNWWTTKLTDSSFNNYVKWVAHYGTESNNAAGTANPDWHPDQEYSIWQYTSCGTVSGINSKVDMNILFKW